MINFPFAGLIMKLPCWGQPPDQNCYDDSLYWEVKIQYQKPYKTLTGDDDRRRLEYIG